MKRIARDLLLACCLAASTPTLAQDFKVVWSTVGVFDLRRTPTEGPSDERFSWGQQLADRGLLCDWDADGTDEVVI